MVKLLKRILQQDDFGIPLSFEKRYYVLTARLKHGLPTYIEFSLPPDRTLDVVFRGLMTYLIKELKHFQKSNRPSIVGNFAPGLIGMCPIFTLTIRTDEIENFDLDKLLTNIHDFLKQYEINVVF